MNDDVISNKERTLPETIGIVTNDLAPLLQKWRADNIGVPWSTLLRRALKKELKPYAGKRYAHLVSEAA